VLGALLRKTGSVKAFGCDPAGTSVKASVSPSGEALPLATEREHGGRLEAPCVRVERRSQKD